MRKIKFQVLRALTGNLSYFVGDLLHLFSYLPLDIEVCPTDGVIQSSFKDTNTRKISDGGRFISGFGAGVIEALLIVTPVRQP
ncbi:hypothetical protein L2E82_48312 [Cichorium intybus]|uniref:Uncharacterized protein n=1 Tax=Cichorium intybus TaxID=13427 RepID=A0ACB8YXT9_CICIN|nr:hypothetical protein L2E82_48312 [Cichorium intybus]